MKLKQNNLMRLFLLLGSILMLFAGCEKEDLIELPVVKTVSVTNPMYYQATVTGSVISTGGFDILERGICWNTNPNPTISNFVVKDPLNDLDDFPLNLENLMPNTTIYARAYGISSEGPSYGEELSFTLWLGVPQEPVIDIDKNSYLTVRIGEQVWMKENLKTTRYRNGDTIAHITMQEDSLWLITEQGAYCAYDDDLKNAEVYGYLYNGYTVFDERKICPQGWHIPSNPEWQALIHYLGQNTTFNAGSLLKSTEGWETNQNSSNLSGFTALPGGLRWHALPEWASTDYWSIKSQAFFATSDEADFDPYWMWYASVASYHGSARVHYNITKTNGMSIRCIKD